jgi:hypothetical protein
MHRRHRFILTALCACALTFSGSVASASQAKGKGNGKHVKHDNDARKDKDHARPVATSGSQMRFRGLDANNDGVITKSEWRGSDRAFANQDWNHDGVLSGDEVRPGAARPAAQAPKPHSGGGDPDEVLFARFDVNRNGVLSRSEFNGSAETFNSIDFNHDGVLTPYEFGVGR